MIENYVQEYNDITHNHQSSISNLKLHSFVPFVVNGSMGFRIKA
jgi:hypothetical protein